MKKRQRQRRSPCAKKKYSDEKKAKHAAKIFRGKIEAGILSDPTPRPIEHYLCDKCGLWHLGHMRMSKWRERGMPSYPLLGRADT